MRWPWDTSWNVTALVNTSGVVVERYVYDPYGRATTLAPDWSPRTSSQFAWVYLHQGGRYDAAADLYHFRNRDYLPSLMRWLNQDPMRELGGANLYEYLADEPLANTDPFGLSPSGGDQLLSADQAFAQCSSVTLQEARDAI